MIVTRWIDMWIILVLLAVLGPGVAAAQPAAQPAPEALDPERADIKRLIESSQALRTAERHLADAIKCCSTPATRPALATALSRFHTTQVDHWRALAFLLHTGTENPAPRPELPPKEWHSRAWFHIDRYKNGMKEIQNALTAAQGIKVENAAYQENLRRARDIWIPNAQAHVNKMDRSLPYLDPSPVALRPGKTVTTIIGPHGDYRRTQWLINRGKNYAMDAYGALIIGYREGADAARVRDAWTQSSTMLDVLDHTSGLFADVTFSAEEASEDRFCRALRAQKLLSVEAAQRYRAWGDVVAGFLPEPYKELVAKIVDSWMHSVDLGGWASLVFPQSDRCTSAFLKD